MRVVHRVAYNVIEEPHFRKKKVDTSRFETDIKGQSEISAILVPDDDAQWPLIKKIGERREMVILTWTEYSEKELDDSPFVAVSSKWVNGFPEPMGEHIQWMQASFDLASYCERCGTGLVQNAPIRIKEEPKWSKTRQTRQLLWVEDLLFASREAYEDVFAPFGIEAWPVHSRSQVVYEGSVQVMPQGTGTAVPTPDYQGTKCRTCGRVKYVPGGVGFAPSVLGCDKDFVSSDIRLGAGGEARANLYASAALYRTMKSAELNLYYSATEPSGAVRPW